MTVHSKHKGGKMPMKKADMMMSEKDMGAMQKEHMKPPAKKGKKGK